MCHDDYAPLGAIVFSPWQAKVNTNGLFLPPQCGRKRDDGEVEFGGVRAAAESAIPYPRYIEIQ